VQHQADSHRKYQLHDAATGRSLEEKGKEGHGLGGERKSEQANLQPIPDCFSPAHLMVCTLLRKYVAFDINNGHAGLSISPHAHLLTDEALLAAAVKL
nr:hypothetical protein [Tanacetum cinerariifolium]